MVEDDVFIVNGLVVCGIPGPVKDTVLGNDSAFQVAR